MRKPFIAVLLTIAMTVASCMPICGAESSDRGATDDAALVINESETGIDETESNEAITDGTVIEEATDHNSTAEEKIEETVSAEQESSAAVAGAEETEAGSGDIEEATAVADTEEEATTVAEEETVTVTEEKAATESDTEEAATESDTEEKTTTAAETEDTASTEEIVEILPDVQSYQPEEDISADDLFAAYVDDEFGISNALVDKQKGRKVNAGSKLSGVDKGIYNYISAELPKIASGKQTSSVFEVPVDKLGLTQLTWTADDLGVTTLFEDGNLTSEASAALQEKARFDLSKIVDALLADHPYLLYWYDKTQKTTGSYCKFTKIKVGGEYKKVGISGNYTINLPVAGAYSSGDYVVDSSVGQSVQSAVSNAQGIVSKYSGGQDLDILDGYRVEICDLTSYNREAIANSEAYGNPWQLIWVFDGDPDTEVVCEGYSKAFKYLCDETEFAADIGCIVVAGDMNGEGHMWNIVNMDDDQNYLVDVTNCDARSDDSLFLVGSEGSPEEGYTIGTLTYVYDDNELELWDSEDLTLKVHGYGAHVAGDWVTVKEPTCEEVGIEHKVCTLCGDELEVAEIAALGHVWETECRIDVEPTCERAGSKSIHCSVCGESQDESGIVIPALGHDYGDWETTKEPTCEETGSRHRICSRCNDEIIEEIPALGHVWETEYTTDVKATCETAGSKSIHCSVCGESQDDTSVEIAALGHKYGNWVTTRQPTASAVGIMERTCSTCGNKEYKAIAKLITITASNITGVKNKYYTGSAIVLPVKVVVNGKTLTQGTDYTISYKNNKYVGYATITVVGKGLYTGTAVKKFIIAPKKTYFTSLVAGTGKITFKWKKQAVQTTGYQVQVALNSSFTKGFRSTTVTSPKKLTVTISRLTSGKKYYVRIRTYRKTSAGKFYSGWSTLKTIKVK